MTHPDGSAYTPAERRAIIAEARATAAELLSKLELLATLDSAPTEWEGVTSERGGPA
jgi:hypothetical protein